jgi:hypothetical protein
MKKWFFRKGLEGKDTKGAFWILSILLPWWPKIQKEKQPD